MNILKRYVLGEVLRAFLLALLTMTAIFVLFMVAAEAMRSKLLTPSDVLELVPYVIPSTLPYTMPVSLLFAVTVVYGRIAGDNEVIAVKSAGLNVVTTLILPTILLATVLSAFLFHVSRGWIPSQRSQGKARPLQERRKTPSTSSSSATASSITRNGPFSSRCATSRAEP